MPVEVRDEKTDEMILLNATLVALICHCANSHGVDHAVSYLQSADIERAEAEEVGAINLKALTEGDYNLVQIEYVDLASKPYLAPCTCSCITFRRKKRLGACPRSG